MIEVFSLLYYTLHLKYKEQREQTKRFECYTTALALHIESILNVVSSLYVVLEYEEEERKDP